MNCGTLAGGNVTLTLTLTSATLFTGDVTVAIESDGGSKSIDVQRAVVVVLSLSVLFRREQTLERMTANSGRCLHVSRRSLALIPPFFLPHLVALLRCKKNTIDDLHEGVAKREYFYCGSSRLKPALNCQVRMKKA